MGKIVVLKQFLSPKRATILERWLKLPLSTYPTDGSRFLRQEKNSSPNPAGYTLSREIEALHDRLLPGMAPENPLPPPITSSESGQSRISPPAKSLPLSTSEKAEREDIQAISKNWRRVGITQ